MIRYNHLQIIFVSCMLHWMLLKRDEQAGSNKSINFLLDYMICGVKHSGGCE